MEYPGRDWSTFTGEDGQADLDPTFAEISGTRVVLELVARRLISTPGSHDEPDYGYDLTALRCASLTEADVFIIEGSVQSEARKVEGVANARCQVFLDDSFVLTIQLDIELDDAEGTVYPMVFVLSGSTRPRIILPKV